VVPQVEDVLVAARVPTLDDVEGGGELDETEWSGPKQGEIEVEDAW
jgi:hypothetical protein